MSETTLGVIVGNRGFFPDALARDGRDEVLQTLEAAGYKTVCLTPDDTIIIDGVMRARPGVKVAPQPGRIQPEPQS